MAKLLTAMNRDGLGKGVCGGGAPATPGARPLEGQCLASPPAQNPAHLDSEPAGLRLPPGWPALLGPPGCCLPPCLSPCEGILWHWAHCPAGLTQVTSGGGTPSKHEAHSHQQAAPVPASHLQLDLAGPPLWDVNVAPTFFFMSQFWHFHPIPPEPHPPLLNLV